MSGHPEDLPSRTKWCALVGFSEQIGRMLRKRGMNKAQLERATGVGLYPIMSADANPTLSTMAKLAHSLGCHLEIRLATDEELVRVVSLEQATAIDDAAGLA